MNDYRTIYRTTYFRITDEAAYQKLLSGVDKSEEFVDFTVSIKNEIWHSFGDYRSFSYYPEFTVQDAEDFIEEYPNAIVKDIEELRFEGESKIDFFFESLSKIIHQEDACILTEYCHKSLELMMDSIFVVTKDNVDFVSSTDIVKKILWSRLGNRNVLTAILED